MKTAHLLKPSELRPLRQLGDPVADALVDFLALKPGQDALKAIEDHFAEAEQQGREPARQVAAFWREARAEVPPEVSGFVQGAHATDSKDDGGAHGGDGYGTRATPDEAIARNDRFGRDGRAPSLEEGQAVFWRYSGHIFQALSHFSLAGGFSSPNLSAVLRQTQYLTSNSKDATYRRLLETTLFVLDAMTDMSVGSTGWKSATRVRLLHAQVRRKIRLRTGSKEVYDQQVSGVPINQADLATVLGSFMIAPTWSMRRSGVTMSPFEAASYQAAWRHIG